MLKELLTYRPPMLTIKHDQIEQELRMFNLAVAVCRFNGGAMMTAPFADPADGILDITTFENMSKLRVLREHPKMRKDTIFSNPKIKAFRTKRLEIDGVHGPDSVEADGELVGSTPAVFTVNLSSA